MFKDMSQLEIEDMKDNIVLAFTVFTLPIALIELGMFLLQYFDL